MAAVAAVLDAGLASEPLPEGDGGAGRGRNELTASAISAFNVRTDLHHPPPCSCYVLIKDSTSERVESFSSLFIESFACLFLFFKVMLSSARFYTGTGDMAIRVLLSSQTRRCETTVVAIDGRCLSCGAGRDEACALRMPLLRRLVMERRRRREQLERLGIQLDNDPLISFENAAWWS